MIYSEQYKEHIECAFAAFCVVKLTLSRMSSWDKVLLSCQSRGKNVLILYSYCHYTDAQIGQIYGRSRSTANYWKLAALKQLGKELERLKHE